MDLLHDLSIGNPPDELNVVIEIPKGSANKYEVDKETSLIFHDRVFYGSHVYPADYGFVPQSHWYDGDPLDAMVMSTHAFVPGVVVPARPIGVIRMIDNGEKDEKLVCVPVNDPRFDGYRDITDVAPHLLKEWQNFFETYKMLEKKSVTIEKIEGRTAAVGVVAEAQELYREKFGK